MISFVAVDLGLKNSKELFDSNAIQPVLLCDVTCLNHNDSYDVPMMKY